MVNFNTVSANFWPNTSVTSASAMKYAVVVARLELGVMVITLAAALIAYVATGIERSVLFIRMIPLAPVISALLNVRVMTVLTATPVALSAGLGVKVNNGIEP